MPSGVIQATGDFVAGESIDILGGSPQKVIAKGISQYSKQDLLRIMGAKSSKIIDLLGYCPSKVVIHRDDMVVLKDKVRD